MLHSFAETALSICFDAVPNAKALHTFAETALALDEENWVWCRHPRRPLGVGAAKDRGSSRPYRLSDTEINERFALNKRALMLTGAIAVLLSGRVYADALPNPPCNTSQTSYCDITTGATLPVYTGAANPDLTSSQQYSGLGSITVDTNGSIVIGTNPPDGPAVTINSGSASAPAIVTNNTNITYTGVSYAVGVLLEEASVPTSSIGYGTAENWTGEFENLSGTLNLTGTGSNKVGILIAGGAYDNSTSSGSTSNAPTGLYANTAYTADSPTTPVNLGVFTGVVPSGGGDPVAIYLATGSTVEVQGTNSYGIKLIGPTYSGTVSAGTASPSGGASLIGDIDIGGALTMTPTTLGSTTQGQQNVAIEIDGWMQPSATSTAPNPALAGTPYAADAVAMVGNIDILAGGAVTSEGAGARGLVVLGAIQGDIVNSGQLSTFGTSSPSATASATDPEGGYALAIGNDITGGIFNSGPTTTTSAATGTISMIGNAETIYISPALNQNEYVPITIGAYTDSAGYQYSLLNRGNITASSEDANVSNVAIDIAGQSKDVSVTLPSGIFNSGRISSQAATNASGSAVSATALLIQNYVFVDPGKGGYPGSGVTGATQYALVNSNEAGSGTISAAVSGAQMGTATAIYIAPQTAGSQTPTNGLASIYNSGTIAASAFTTNLLSPGNLSQTGPGFAAFAIRDLSGTLTTIYNAGTISAVATQLDNNSQIADAIDTSSNLSNPVTVINQSSDTASAKIIGDIHFGALQGTLDVSGTIADPASVNGNIYFNNETATSQTPKDDTIDIGANSTVIGEISEEHGGSVDISIADTGMLDLLTTLPTNPNSTGSVQTQANTPLRVGTLAVDTGGTLEISLSQGSNVNAFAQNVTVINAANVVNIGGDGVTPTLTLTFGSFVGTPSTSGASSEFVLLSAPSAATFTISPQELSLLTATYDSALSPAPSKNGIPFLFKSEICTFHVSDATGSEMCSAIDPTLQEPYSPTNQELVLVLTPKTTEDLGLRGYAAKMFSYVNQALVNDNTLGAAMVNDITNTAQAQAAYASFAPDVSGATRATAISLTDSATNIVAARQRKLRMYANQEGDTTLWGQEFAQRLSQANSSDLTGYNDSGFGFVLGFDEGDPADGRYGGAFTFFTGGMSQKEPTSAKTRSQYYLLTGYTDWRGKGLFVDTQITAGYGDLKGKRYLKLVDTSTNPPQQLNREAENTRPSELVAAGITTGGIFTAGSTVVMPQLSVDALAMREEAYTETNGGNGFDLRVQPYYANSARAFLGADVRHDFNFGDFYLQPELRAGYRYDFFNGAVKLKANFVSVGAANGQALSPFSITGPDPGHGNIVLGGGLATTTGDWSIGINYDFVRSGSGPTQQSGILTLIGRI